MNNIFEFAPKELVQDAFLCWCFNFKKEDGEEEWNFTKNIIQGIYEITGGKEKLEIENIRIEKQFGNSKIDVLLEIKTSNGKINFIFENKLYTSHHSDQLERHIETINQEELEGEKKYIYFKLGYLYKEDTILPEVYTLLNREDFIKLLEKNKIDSDIYRMYYNFVKKIDNDEKEIFNLLEKNEKLSEDEKKKVFKGSVGQYEILKKIGNELNIDVKHFHGVSRGGTPWSTFDIIKTNHDGVSKTILWRIDSRKGDIPYISLKYLKECKKNEQDNVFLEDQRNIFKEIAKGFENLEFDKINNGCENHYLREIGILFFDNGKNTIPNIIKEIPKFTELFVKKVNEENAYYKKICVNLRQKRF